MNIYGDTNGFDPLFEGFVMFHFLVYQKDFALVVGTKNLEV